MTQNLVERTLARHKDSINQPESILGGCDLFTAMLVYSALK